MLSPEERQSARQYAEHCSSTLKDDEREQMLQKAHSVIDMLREKFGDDEAAYNAAQIVSYLMAGIAITPVGRVADLLDGSMAAYGFAAANLAGVYELPEREDGKTETPTSVPVGESPSSNIGQYL